MNFGKLGKIEGLDFSMPPDPKATVKLLESLPKTPKTAEIYSGCTGWSVKEWLGTYYPNGTKTQDFLKAYAQQFNTIELNSTYYRIPDKKTVEKWVEQTFLGFKFSPKIPKIISHSSDLSLNQHYIENFTEVISHLGNRLGTSFLQLPPHFSPSHLRLLEQFLKRFPIADIPLSIEIRNENWFTERDMEIFQQLLFHYGAGTVISDVAGRRDVLHMYLSNDSVIIRFVGNDLDPSDFSRLDNWVDRLKNWFDKGLKTLYFFHHQDNQLLAPEMTAYLNQKLNGLLDFNLKIPVKHCDTQMSLF